MPEIDQTATDIPRPTRGLKNCNPGNLKFVAVRPFQGQIGCDSRGFGVYDTDVNGLRALIVDLNTHFKRDHENTILALITTFAPPTENDTKNYADFVGKHLNMAPTAVIREFTPDFATHMAHAIVHMEQGIDPYSDDTYAHAVALAFIHIRGDVA